MYFQVFPTFSGPHLVLLSLGMRNRFLMNYVQSYVIAALWVVQDKKEMTESAWDFDQSTSFLIYSRQLSYLEKILDILLKVSDQRSKRTAD